MKINDQQIDTVLHLLYRYQKMRLRCNTKPRYYERKINIHSVWQGCDGVRRFVRWAIDHGFKKNLTLDRIDNDKGYYPKNCQWITQSENCRKSPQAKFVIFRGKKINVRTLAESKHCKVSISCFRGRMYMGWPVKRALIEPQHHGHKRGSK